jgi:hypothetical protein
VRYLEDGNLLLLKINSLVVHFQDKAFNPSHMLCISLWMLGEGQQIRELKLGGVNHDGMRK